MSDTPLIRFRADKDQFFRHDRYSPLLPEQKQDFKGLHYYPENPDFRIVTALERYDTPQSVSMLTSTGVQQEYYRAGQIRFQAGGQTNVLQVYESIDQGSFFLPFTDATSGNETYGAGRYVEVETLPDGQVLVDFNLAYNPYCAYNEHWSCPIPLRENRLTIRVEAGEKNFH
jgi:uncharacterized protein